MEFDPWHEMVSKHYQEWHLSTELGVVSVVQKPPKLFTYKYNTPYIKILLNTETIINILKIVIIKGYKH